MPYKVSGNKVMHKKGLKWSVKQTCRSHAAAVDAMQLLQGIEHGWHPTGKGARKQVPTK
jgi:hypothetical protein